MEYVAGLMLGLAGGLHCAGMCGPIAATVGRSNAYLVGRVLTYAVLGAAIGFGSSVITLGVYSRTVSIIGGVLMIVFATLQIVWHWNPFPQHHVLRLTKPIRERLQGLLQRRSAVALLGIGALNGLLPCGLVASALFGAAATTSTLGGALFMLLFGIGTLPVMATIAYGGTWLKQRLNTRYRMVVPFVALLIGAATVVRGMGLGIPLLSPKPLTILQENGCCGGGHLSHAHPSQAR